MLIAQQYTETVFQVNHRYTDLDIPQRGGCGDYADMEFTANLKRYRDAKGWNQWDVAERVGVAQATVQRWENGKREPSHADLEKLAGAFGVSVSALFREPNEAPLPTAAELAYMIQGAMNELLVGVSYADYPQAVSSGLLARLEQFQASGGFRATEDEAIAADTEIQPRLPTKRGAAARSRSQ